MVTPISRHIQTSQQCHYKPGIVSLSVIFETPSNPNFFSLEPFSVKLFLVQLMFPQLTQQIRACHFHPTLTSSMEKAATVSFPLLFISPHSKLCLTAFFQSNYYPIHRASCSPSVNQGKKFPPSPSLHCLLPEEDGDGEFSSFFPFQTFSYSIFFS